MVSQYGSYRFRLKFLFTLFHSLRLVIEHFSAMFHSNAKPYLPRILYGLIDILGNAVTHLVEALRFKPEVRGFDFLTVVLGSTRPLTEMSTRNISWGVRAAGA